MKTKIKFFLNGLATHVNRRQPLYKLALWMLNKVPSIKRHLMRATRHTSNECMHNRKALEDSLPLDVKQLSPYVRRIYESLQNEINRNFSETR